jgi:hypothetical protein
LYEGRHLGANAVTELAAGKVVSCKTVNPRFARLIAATMIDLSGLPGTRAMKEQWL